MLDALYLALIAGFGLLCWAMIAMCGRLMGDRQ